MVNILISLERLSAYNDISDVLNPELLRPLIENGSKIKIKVLISGYSPFFSKYFEKEHECDYIIQQLNNTFIGCNNIEYDDGFGRNFFILYHSDIDIIICEKRQIGEKHVRNSQGKIIPVYDPYDNESLDKLKEYLDNY